METGPEWREVKLELSKYVGADFAHVKGFGLVSMAIVGISVNLVLMALNLLPIPPLDGGRIAVSLLPLPAARAFARLEPFGLFVIVALLALGVLDDAMRPLLRGAEWLLQALLGH